MFDHYDDIYDTDVNYFGSSPPRRPVIVESSDLFRAVMEECLQDEGRLGSAVIDSVMKRSSNRGSADLQNSTGDICQMCNKFLTKSGCRCSSRTSKRRDSAKSYNRCVQWIDEIFDKPLAREANIDRVDSPVGLPSPRDSNIKPILKHRANCVIIISE